jgi:hypothetical protein
MRAGTAAATMSPAPQALGFWLSLPGKAKTAILLIL